MITCLFLCEKVDSRFTQCSADVENVLAFNKAVISFVFFFFWITWRKQSHAKAWTSDHADS